METEEPRHKYRETNKKAIRWNDERSAPISDEEYSLLYDPESRTWVFLGLQGEDSFFEFSIEPEVGFGELTADNETFQIRISKRK